MALVAPEPIETARLRLRLLQKDDLPALLGMNTDPEVTALLPYATWHSLADGEAWYDRMRAIESTGQALQFVVVAKSTGSAIGTCLLFRHDAASARIELGYALSRACWRQGFMREALVALLGRAFAGMGVRRVEAEVNTRNEASSALLARLGFTKEGVLRQRWVTKGRAVDVEMHGLLAGELRGDGSGATARSSITAGELRPAPP